jgi:hypothetical protein
MPKKDKDSALAQVEAYEAAEQAINEAVWEYAFRRMADNPDMSRHLDKIEAALESGLSPEDIRLIMLREGGEDVSRLASQSRSVAKWILLEKARTG